MGLELMLKQMKLNNTNPDSIINGIEAHERSILSAQNKSAINISNKIINTSSLEYQMSEEENLLQIEYDNFMEKLMDEIHEFLGERTFNNLVDWALSGQTFRQIAHRERTSFQAVQQRVTSRMYKLAEYLDKKYGKEKLLKMKPPYRTLYKVPTSTNTVTFPFELAMRTPVYMEIIRNKHNVPSYKHIEVCRVLDDLKVAFGDDKTVCTYCKKCKVRKGKTI